MLAERFSRTIGRNRLYWRTLGAAALALLLLVGISARQSWVRAVEDYVGDLEIAAQTVVESLAFNPVPPQTVDKILQTVSFGSIHYAQWVERGRVIAERRSPAAAALPLPPLAQPPRMREVRRTALPSGEPLVDIVVPLPGPGGLGSGGPPQPQGYLRLGASLVPAIWRALVEVATLLGWALLALLGTALFTAAALLLRARHPKGAPAEGAGPRPQGQSRDREGAKPPGAAPDEGGPDAAGAPVRWVGDLGIDEAQRRVFRRDGTRVDLSPKEYSLLVLLASRPGRVFSDAEIREHLWPNGHGFTRKDVTHYVYLLRKKLERQGVPAELIENVRGHGYRLSI